jgi:hypothetical protein
MASTRCSARLIVDPSQRPVWSDGAADPNRPFTNAGNWPGPRFPYGRHELTLAGRADESRVSFLARPRTHTAGHYPTLATGRRRADQIKRLAC